jgi:hypothetical protein
MLQLGDQIAEAIMLELPQQSVRYVGGDVATSGSFPDLRSQAFRNSDGQLLRA